MSVWTFLNSQRSPASLSTYIQQEPLREGITPLEMNMTESDTATQYLPSGSGDMHDKEEGPGSSSPDEAVQPTSHEPQRTTTGFRWFLICFAIFSANFLYGLDATIAADIQAPVARTFNDVQKLGWLGFGFGLGSTASILPVGKAYGVFDIKWVFIASLTLFSAASALCGAAPTMDALILGRVLAGSGGAGMYLGTLNLMTQMTTQREQGLYIGLEGLVYGGGCLLGPVVGGLFSDSAATWRWAFYLNLVIFGVFSPIYLFTLPSLPQKAGHTLMEKFRGLDWLGIVLSIGMYTSFVLAFAFGGAIWAWSDPRFIALIVVFAVLLAVFGITQHLAVFTNKIDRLYPCEFLADPRLILINVAMSAPNGALFIATYYIPLYFQFVHGDSGTQAAVRLLPFVAFFVTALMVCGYALPRAGRHWLWFFGAGIILTAGGATMYTVEADTPAGQTYGFSVLLGLGLASVMAPYSMVPYMVQADRIPEAIQFLNNAQGQSQMLGLLIANAIFQSEALAGVRGVLESEGYSDAQIRDAVAGAHSQTFQELSEGLKRSCIDVIVSVIQYEWLLVVVAGVVTTICGALMPVMRVETPRRQQQKN